MAQGYYDREDESIAMRKRKHRTKQQLKDSRDESYGDWGKRSKDWKGKGHAQAGTGHTGHVSGQHDRPHILKHMNPDLAYMPIVDREKDAMKKGDK